MKNEPPRSSQLAVKAERPRLPSRTSTSEPCEQPIAAWVALCLAATSTGDVVLTQVGRHALAELGAPAAMTEQVGRSVGHAAAVADRPLMATITFHDVFEPLE